MRIQQNSPNENITNPNQSENTTKGTQTGIRAKQNRLSTIATKEGKKGLIQTKKALYAAKQSPIKSKNTPKTKGEPIKAVTTGEYNIIAQGDKIFIELCNDEMEDDKTKELSKSLSDIREYIAARYNWNAIVKMMKFCAQNDPDFTYKVPTNLAGTTQDNQLIMPDAGMLSIVRMQLEHALTEAKAGFTEYSEILGKVDAEPGNYFATKIMCEPSKNDLLNEEDNHTMKDEQGQKIQVPKMNASPAVLYKNLRALVLARNGLWSDKQNVTNLVGLRRKLAEDITKYDDSLIVCWVDEQGTKHAKVYAATTEPGEISNHRQMTAQTLTMEPGYHDTRQPAGRTSKFLVRNKNNSEVLKFAKDDTDGFNFHDGGNDRVSIEGVYEKGLSHKRYAKTENDFAVNLLYVQAFKILSRWGKNQDKKAYDYLKDMKEAEPYKFQELKDGKASLKKDSEKKATTKEIAPMKTYIAHKYSKDEAGKENFVRIIQSVDSGFQKPKNLATLKEADLKKLITDEHIKGILKKQANYFADISNIDGKPGTSYLDILDGKTDKLTKLKALAKKDFPEIEAIFKKLKDTYKVNDSRIKYLKNLKPGTHQERKYYNQAGINTDQSTKINQDVAGWSDGCQVVFGPEKFYEFWSDVTDKATDTKQRRWYYTLIDEESFKTTTKQGTSK